MTFTKNMLLFVICMLSLHAFSQDDISTILTKKYAENSFREGDYKFALENYLVLYNRDRSNIDLNYRVGICYTESNVSKEKAIQFLEFVVSHNNFPIRAYYYLGRAYMYNYRFTEAVEAFYEFKMMGIDEGFLLEADRLIGKCYNALEYINAPKNVVFERLDTTINTPYDDFNPFITQSGDALYFTSRKTYVPDFEDYISNVFYCEQDKKGNWGSAVSLPVNTYDNEEIVGMTPEAEDLLVYADGDYYTHDLKMVKRKGAKFSDVEDATFPSQINTEGLETGASLSADGNTFVFASDRKGGRGGLDLYIIRKTESGAWGEIENIGSAINSEFDENYPNISSDGKYLYFSSKGHSGIGGYDFFESSYIEEQQKWSTPRNLGFPINTPLDNTTISFMPDGKTAYVADNRKEGMGDLDIYKLTFGSDTIQATIWVGTVMVRTQAGEVPYSEDFLMAYATLYDLHGNIYAQYEVQADGGQFFATIYPGTYRLEVNFSGEKGGYSKELVITGKDEYIMETVVLPNVD